MKKLGILAAFAAAMMLALGLTACGGSGNSGGSGGSGAGGPSSAETSAAPAAGGAADTSAAPAAGGAAAPAAAGATLSAADLAAVTDKVAFGDYDAMEKLAKAIQNGEKADAVVEIDGLVSNFAKGMSYNIVQNSADGSKNIGTVFVIEGADESAYPADGAHVKIVGKVMKDESGAAFNIHTLPEFVEVLG